MKLKITFNDYGVRELRNLVRQNDDTLLMRAMDRGVDSSSIKTNTMLDMTFRSTGGTATWNQLVRFYPIFYGEFKGELKFDDFKNKLENSNVGIYCDCPHFEYSGAAYSATREDYAIVNESRAPTKTNKPPMMCKHCYNAVTVVNRNMDRIARKYYELLKTQKYIIDPSEKVEEPMLNEIITEEPVVDDVNTTSIETPII